MKDNLNTETNIPHSLSSNKVGKDPVITLVNQGAADIYFNNRKKYYFGGMYELQDE